MDRFFDNYIRTPMQRIVGDRLRPAEARDSFGVSEARTLLDTAYQWLVDRMSGGQWAAGDSFTLSDCAAAPSLFYADWAPPTIGIGWYRERECRYVEISVVAGILTKTTTNGSNKT